MAVAMFFVPDSPRYLVHKGKEEAARKALRWFRGSEYIGVEEELTALQNAEKEQNDEGSKVSIVQLFTKSIYLKPLGISMGLMFFQQFSGINQVLIYLQAIFLKAGSDMDPGLNGFLVTLIQAS